MTYQDYQGEFRASHEGTSALPPPPSPSRIEQLTGLRFVAALAVLLSHFSALTPLPGFEFLAELGGHGVTLFFVLSGFVLTHRYDSHGSSSNSPQRSLSIKNYAWARLARIVPVYWLSLLATLVAYNVFGAHISLGPAPADVASGALSFALSWFALQAWVPDVSVQQFWNAPGWSVSSEMFFYACFPLLVRFKWLSGSGRSLILTGIFFFVLLAIYLGTLVFLGNTNAEPLQFAARVPLLGVYPFVFGILACRRWFDASPVSAKHTGASIWTLGIALVAGAWLFQKLTGQITQATELLHAPLIFTLLWIHCWYVPMFTLLIYLLARCNGGPAHFLQSAPMKLLGNASYSLYLFHWLPLGWLIHHYGAGGGPWWVSLLAIVFLMGGSVAVYLGFEAPARLRILKVRSTLQN